MKKIFLNTISLSLVLSLAVCSCSKEELDVRNPNEPTVNVVQDEATLIPFASGAVYRKGFNGITDSKYTGFLGDSYFSICYAYHELMGDVIGASAANAIINQVGVPDKVTYDNASNTTNTARQMAVLRINNSRSSAGANPFFYEWTYMYFLNNACNVILDKVATIPDAKFSGNAATKKATLRAWAYWWKGYAYARVGSIYYAGLINNAPDKTDGKYVNSAALIAESNANFDKAVAALGAATDLPSYTALMEKLIPDFCQVGLGAVPTAAMWTRNVNSMKARNLLVNKKVSAMTAADWASVATLASNGIQAGDMVFAGRSAATNNFFSPAGGYVAARAINASNTYIVTERLTQEFRTGDMRFANNFRLRTTPYFDQGGTIIYGTRYQLVEDGAGMPNVIVYGSKTAGAYELYIGSSYEETALMRAEALIRQGGAANIDAGTAIINAVRTAQGAGLAAIAPGATQAVAIEDLRRERRVALLFRGLSFYDARRWGVIDPISQGGGRTGAVVLGGPTSSTLNTNATIDYNFLDYWDVPDDETALNPPASGSAPVKNPRQ
jgi:starch-binding outer membrane protein, SusD/RagB family